MGTERTPLSGENSRHTSADTLHDDIFVEVKMRDSISKFLNKTMRKTVENTKQNAKDEEKDWVVVFKEKNKYTDYALIDFEFLQELLEESGRIDTDD